MTAFLVTTNIIVACLLPIAFKNDYPNNPIRLGALWGPLVFSGEWWRLITANFVHINLFHLLPNMMGLWILGKRVEKLLGGTGFVGFYLGCGVLGSLALVVLHRFSGGYGSSLCIAGLAGLLLVIYGVSFWDLPKRTKWKVGLLFFYATGLASRELLDTHFFAHTIGLVIGICFGAGLMIVARNRLNTYWSGRAVYVPVRSSPS